MIQTVADKHMTTINIQPKIVNLCEPVREACDTLKVSTVRVVDACNSHLARLARATDKEGNVKPIVANTGDMKLNGKQTKATISVKISAVQFTDGVNIVSRFLAWHNFIEKANEVARMNDVRIPGMFNEWINKFAVSESTPVA